MLDLFANAADDALDLIGEGAVLRGQVPCQVNIEHGVQLEGFDFSVSEERYVTLPRSVATIASKHNPRVGDSLTHPDGNFLLDVMVADAGSLKRFVVVKV
jgi:hypothetical protein